MFENEESHPHIMKMPNLETSLDPRGIGYVFFHKMKEHNNKIVQIDGVTGETQTFKLLLKLCTRTAIAMQINGVKPLDIISICSENRLELIVPYFAAFFIGARSVCLHPYSSKQQNTILLEHTGVEPKLMFASTRTLPLINEFTQTHQCKIINFDCGTAYTSLKEFLQPTQEEDTFQPYEAVDHNEIAVMQFSSGSSGLPKLVCISHHAYLGQTAIRLKYVNYDRILMYATLYWTTSSIFWAVTIFSGGLRITLPKYDGEEVFRLIHVYKPSFVLLGRYISLNINPTSVKECDVTSVKCICVGGGALTKGQLLWLRGIFPTSEVWNYYGITEVGLTTYPSTNSPQDTKLSISKLKSCGKGVVGRWYKVVNPETEEILGPDQIGELRVKSKFSATCYYNSDPDKLFDSQGWLKTGDLVYYDVDGYFYIVDRLKDMIRVKGENVYPLSLESILLSHPSVKEVVVVRKTDVIYGDVPLAAVVQKGKNVSEEELVQFVDGQVTDDYMKLRGGVVFVDQMPLTISVTVNRNGPIEQTSIIGLTYSAHKNINVIFSIINFVQII